MTLTEATQTRLLIFCAVTLVAALFTGAAVLRAQQRELVWLRDDLEEARHCIGQLAPLVDDVRGWAWDAHAALFPESLTEGGTPCPPPVDAASAPGPDSAKPTARPVTSTSAPSQDSTATAAQVNARTPQGSSHEPVGAFSGAPTDPWGSHGYSPPTESTPSTPSASPMRMPPEPATDPIGMPRQPGPDTAPAHAVAGDTLNRILAEHRTRMNAITGGK